MLAAQSISDSINHIELKEPAHADLFISWYV